MFYVPLWSPRGEGKKQEHQVGPCSSLDESSRGFGLGGSSGYGGDMDFFSVLEVKPVGQVHCVGGRRAQEESSWLLRTEHPGGNTY